MKQPMIKKFLCVAALSLTPFLALGDETNSGNIPSTGYLKDPGRAMQVGDMGFMGVGQTDGATKIHVDDATLSRKVEAALKSDAKVRNLDIGVAVKNGIVTLFGDAKDIRWEARALDVANGVLGVRAIVNKLTVGIS